MSEYPSVRIRDPRDPGGIWDSSMHHYVSRSCELCPKGEHVGPAHKINPPRGEGNDQDS
jgi:hypothetical protein